jgi:hypothetical protein
MIRPKHFASVASSSSSLTPDNWLHTTGLIDRGWGTKARSRKGIGSRKGIRIGIKIDDRNRIQELRSRREIGIEDQMRIKVMNREQELGSGLRIEIKIKNKIEIEDVEQYRGKRLD